MSSSFIETGLSPDALRIHRALASLQEELEAIDFYHQRQDVTDDASLKALLEHNRDDEMEHAAMLLEWLRRALPGLDGQLRTFLFQDGAPTSQEVALSFGASFTFRVLEPGASVALKPLAS